MPNLYSNRDILKAALSLPASATDKHTLLDAALEGVCREIDAYVGFQFFPSSGTRYYRPSKSLELDLDYPLLNIDSIELDTDGDATYEITLTTSDYFTVPYNATEKSPPDPHFALEIRDNATAVFPTRVQRGAKVKGTWGYYDEREETTAKPSTAITAAQTTIKFSGAANLHPGQTIRVDDEQMFVVANGLSGSDTATASGVVTVQRGLNGTSGATHSSLSTMSVYTYPIVERAALYQTAMDYRAQDAPLGVAAGDISQGGQMLRAPGGLHPFVRRILDQYRVPVAR